MKNNVIEFTPDIRDEFEKISKTCDMIELNKVAANIARKDLFPLHEVYVTYPGKSIEADVRIFHSDESVKFQCVVYYFHRIIGITSEELSDFDKDIWDRKVNVKTLAKNQKVKDEKRFLDKISRLVSTSLMSSFVLMINPEIIKKGTGERRKIFRPGKGDPEEIIYHKLKSNISIESKHEESTRKGSCPQHEFTCRGHYRRNPKTGEKNIWVREHVKCVGRGTRIIHEYV